jgi:hypothetical protein
MTVSSENFHDITPTGLGVRRCIYLTHVPPPDRRPLLPLAWWRGRSGADTHIAHAYVRSRGTPGPLSPNTSRSFAGGVDVFGRLPACRACHALLHNLKGVLLPRLERQLQLERRRLAAGGPDSRRLDFGSYDGAPPGAAWRPPPLTLAHAVLIQEELPGGCAFSSTYHDKASAPAAVVRC